MSIDDDLTFPAGQLGAPAAAAHYASQGLRVFPCAAEQKRPMTENGFKDASRHLGVVQGWWRSWPWANIGIATGGDGVEVLDVDVHRGGDGFAALARLEEAGLVDGWAAKVRTPSGGLHLYFPADPAFPQRNWALAAEHIDFRGEGGYVIAPPSIGPDRHRYEVIATAPSPRPIDAARVREFLSPSPTPSPVSLVERGVERPRDEVVRRIAAWVSGQPEGNRNRALFWAACRVAEIQLPEDYAHGALGRAAQRAGLSEREATTTIRSAYRTVASAPRVDPDEGPGPPLLAR